MTYKVYEISSKRTIIERTPDNTVPVTVSDISQAWIDIVQRDSTKLVELLNSLDVHPLALEASLEKVPNSRIGIYEKSLFIGLPILLDLEKRSRTFLTILCLPGKLITIHEEPLPALNNIIENFSSSISFHSADTSAVLYQMLDYIIDQEIVVGLKIRDMIDALEESFEAGKEVDLAARTDRLRRQAIRLEAILEDQHYCVTALQSIESAAFNVANMKDYFRDLINHLDHAVTSVGRQIDRLTSLRQHFLLQLQDKTNKRLQILTIVSAIFLPLMLVTGIYGMNFRYMPELLWHYGYPATLMFMAVTAAGLIWWLAGKGWFK